MLVKRPAHVRGHAPELGDHFAQISRQLRQLMRAKDDQSDGKKHDQMWDAEHELLAAFLSQNHRRALKECQTAEARRYDILASNYSRNADESAKNRTGRPRSSPFPPDILRIIRFHRALCRGIAGGVQ